MTCSHSLRTRTALALSMATLAMLTASASAAQVTPAPAPAPAPAPPSVAGPPDGLIPPPPPVNQRPLPTPQIFPQPGPAVNPAQPPQPAPKRNATPAPRPSVRPAAPVQVTPAPVPVVPPTVAPLPEPVPSPLPGMSEQSQMPPPPDPSAPAAPPESPDSGTPEWLPLAAIAAVILSLAGALLWWRRRSPPLDRAAPQPPADAIPPRPKPATPRPAAPAPPPSFSARRADLSIDFEPLSAQSTLINLRIRYAVTVRNGGTIDAMPVTVRIGLFAGSNVNPQGIAQWFTLDGEALHHAVDRVAAGGDYRFEGELAAPLEALNPITVEGRLLAVPLVAVDARYNHGDGHAPIDGQSARAFVIGREPSREGAKLAPFRLDQGPTSFSPLGRRDTGISRVV